MDRFTFRVTVGGIIEKDGKILVVRELLTKREPQGSIIIAQPGGHVEDRESILDAVMREVLEETGLTVHATALIGVYQNRFKDNAAIRFSFVCELIDAPKQAITDPDVLDALWMPIEELKTRRSEYRPGSATITFDDYFAGKRYPLDLLQFQDHSGST